MSLSTIQNNVNSLNNIMRLMLGKQTTPTLFQICFSAQDVNNTRRCKRIIMTNMLAVSQAAASLPSPDCLENTEGYSKMREKGKHNEQTPETQ